jgi:hypothetical protein
VEGLGELLFGDAQLLLGFFHLGDVAHHHHQRGGVVEDDVLGREQGGEARAVAAIQGNLDVVQRLALQTREHRRAHARFAPDAQFGGGLAQRLAGGNADLLFEGAVHRQQLPIDAAGKDDDVRAVVEYRGELLFGQAQGLLGVHGFGDVDHQTAQDQVVVVMDERDDVADPHDAPIGGEHPVVEAVVAPGLALGEAEVDGVLGVFRVQGALPEAGFQPVLDRVAEQALGVGRDVGEAVFRQAHFPGDGGEAFHQAAVVLFAVAQGLFEFLPALHFTS